MPSAPLLRTKIVATVGPSCEDPASLTRMAAAGMSVARINLAHGTYADHGRFIKSVRQASRAVGRPIAVLADLAGPKIRVGLLRDNRVYLKAGNRIRLTPRAIQGTSEIIQVTAPRLAKDTRKGEPIFLSDGSMELRVVKVDGGEVECEIVTGGTLLPQKGVNLPNTRLRVPAMTDKDRIDLVHALKIGVDIIALSFVRSVQDVERTRRLMGRPVPLIAKIEKREAVADLDAILAASDGVMVARGDLAVETSLEEVPILQKRIIRRANDEGKPVITATQMLLSMVEAARPTRAEANDVANAILDGSDAVMLSEETARGKHPARAVETMARIARHAEAALDPDAFAKRSLTQGFVASAVSEAAVQVARRVGAKAIVTPTFGGATPRFVARFRPTIPVIALTENPATVQSLCLTWGVYPILHGKMGAFDQTLRVAGEELRKLGILRTGDPYVVTASYPRAHTSNLMTVQVLGMDPVALRERKPATP